MHTDAVPNFDSYLDPRPHEDASDPREECGAEHLDDMDSGGLFDAAHSAYDTELSQRLNRAFVHLAEGGPVTGVVGRIDSGRVRLEGTLACGCRRCVAASARYESRRLAEHVDVTFRRLAPGACALHPVAALVRP